MEFGVVLHFMNKKNNYSKDMNQNPLVSPRQKRTKIELNEYARFQMCGLYFTNAVK